MQWFARDGLPGSSGPAGAKGETGERGNDYVDLVKSNWKQCVWKRDDGKDTGLIQVNMNILKTFLTENNDTKFVALLFILDFNSYCEYNPVRQYRNTQSRGFKNYFSSKFHKTPFYCLIYHVNRIVRDHFI